MFKELNGCELDLSWGGGVVKLYMCVLFYKYSI